MSVLKRRAQQVEKGLTTPHKEEEEIIIDRSRIVSTGSTLLDLAISGRRIRGGGVPTGILMEISGPPTCGKTTILGEMVAHVQNNGGITKIGDAERRMTGAWLQYMGIKISEEDLSHPQTIGEVKELILNTPESDDGKISLTAVDSIAVLMSSLEDEKEDKRGSTRAKELHQLCRKAKAEISKKNRLVCFTNQVIDVQDALPGQKKTKTGGGNAIPFLASLRLEVTPAQGSKIKKKVKIGGNDLEKVIGIHSKVVVIKSSIDAPYRETDIYILFDYGIDDVRANLEYIKTMSGSKTYWVVTDEVLGIDRAINHIEEQSLQDQLREATLNMWYEIDEKFRMERAPKNRGQ
jgi:RecA/RadA recombinase